MATVTICTTMAITAGTAECRGAVKEHDENATLECGAQAEVIVTGARRRFFT
jgi:hypothetical protein